MRQFVDYIKAGRFRVPVCTSCRTKAWPPSPYCPKCLSRTAFRKVKTTGTLLEFSSSHVRDHEGLFGVVDMDGIRLVGSFDPDASLSVGMKVRMSRCGVSDAGTPYYWFDVVK